MLVATAFSLLLSVVAILVSLKAFHYTKRQTELMEGQIQKQDAQDKEELDWSERFERLESQLARISPSLTIQPRDKPPGSGVTLYPSIFPDAKLRNALENYIIVNNGSQFSRRNPRPDELRRTNLRETIRKAEECMADFQKNNPGIDLKYYMG